MNYGLETPFRSLLTGFGIAGLALTAWLVTGPVDPIELTSVLLRFVHVVSAMAWIGLVFFVNFVQLKALEEATRPPATPSRSGSSRVLRRHSATHRT